LASLHPFVRQPHAGKVDGMKTPQQSKIPITEFKKLLGTAASRLSESEIEYLRDWEERLADIFFDWWLRKRNSRPEVAGLPEE
jgi:hypothetical protein